jgi:putative nucleotidyltransferase with HDIG domain
MGRQEALKQFGDKITLPSLPDVVMRINSMIDNPNVGLQEMGALVAKDPAITARVLRLANSGYYGLSQQVTNAEQAATVIGARALRNVAMQVSILQRYEHLKNIPDFDLDEVWQHSTLTALLAQALAESCFRRTGLAPDDFYACGLLHDVGKVVMLEGLVDEYLECVRHARRTGVALHVGEEQVLGYTHVEVGAILAQQWQLPEKVAAAIEFHHGPTAEIVSHPHVGVIAIADQIAYRASSSTFEAALEKLAALANKLLGVTREEFDKVVERARNAQPEAFG